MKKRKNINLNSKLLVAKVPTILIPLNPLGLGVRLIEYLLTDTTTIHDARGKNKDTLRVKHHKILHANDLVNAVEASQG